MKILIFRIIDPSRSSENSANFKFLKSLLDHDKKSKYLIIFAKNFENEKNLVSELKEYKNIRLKSIHYHTYSFLLHNILTKRFIQNLWHTKVINYIRALKKKYRIELVHLVSSLNYDSFGPYYSLNLPLVWGPIEGAAQIPSKSFKKMNLILKLKWLSFNFLNYLYFNYNPMLNYMIKDSKIISGSLRMKKLIKNKFNKASIYLTDTCIEKIRVKEVVKLKNIDSNKLKILWVGTISERKNINYLFDFLKIISKENIIINICGGGYKSNIDKLNNLIFDKQNINYLGKLDKSELNKEYVTSDFVFFTSIRDANTNVFFESYEFLTPCIVTDQMACAEVNESLGLKKLVYSLTKNNDLYNIILELILKKKDPEVYEKFYSKMIKKLIKYNTIYTFKNRVDKILNLYSFE